MSNPFASLTAADVAAHNARVAAGAVRKTYDHQTDNPRQVAEPQRAAGNDPLAAPQAEGGTGGRFLVRLVSIRRRLLDEDNLVSKYHTDLLRYAGILPSDAPGVCKIETSQRKAQKGEVERVEIEITTP